MTTTEPTPLTVPQVAVILGVSRSKAHELVKAGKLRHYRVGAAIRVMPAWVEDYRRANASGPPTAESIPTVPTMFAAVDW